MISAMQQHRHGSSTSLGDTWRDQATWGRIIGLTSGGPLGFPGEVSYGAAKAALENYTMSAAFELAPFGVTANLVHLR